MGRAGNDLYIMQSDVTGAIKIGRSKDVHRRLRQLQTGSPYRLRLVLHLPGQANIERKLHRRVASFRLKTKGEWFHYEALIHLPNEIYELLDLDVVDEWWVKTPL